MSIPIYISALFIALVIAILLAILVGLNYALNKLNSRKATRKVAVTGIVLVSWLGMQKFLASNGFFQDFSAMPPHILLVIIPSIIAIFIVAFSKGFRSILEAIPPQWLIGVQSFRILMEIILWMLFVNAIIPVQMSFEGRNFDVLTGLTAPFAAILFAKRNSKTGIIIWNIFGLVLLLNIVIIALLSTPSPMRYFMNEPANTVIGHWPFIWLPGFVVPFALAMHVLSLRKVFLKS